jgi:predicted sugar kinase
MTSNGSESLNNVFRIARYFLICAIIENTWHKCVEWLYKCREITGVWEVQGLIFSSNFMKLIKYYGDKMRTYDVIPLNWGYKQLLCLR